MTRWQQLRRFWHTRECGWMFTGWCLALGIENLLAVPWVGWEAAILAALMFGCSWFNFQILRQRFGSGMDRVVEYKGDGKWLVH